MQSTSYSSKITCTLNSFCSTCKEYQGHDRHQWGKGGKLTDTQPMVLTMLETQNSDIICGIPTGFELSFMPVRHLFVLLVSCFCQRK